MPVVVRTKRLSRESLELPLLAAALVLPTSLSWFYNFGLGELRDGSTQTMYQLLYSVCKGTQLILPLILLGVSWKKLFQYHPGFVKGLEEGIGFGVLSGIGILLIYYYVLKPAGLMEPVRLRIHTETHAIGALNVAGYFRRAGFIVFAHSFLEEYYWRWFLHGRLSRHIGMWLSILLTSLGFMGHHVVNLVAYFPTNFWSLGAPLSLGIAIGGAFWAWLFHQTKSIVCTWLSHIIVDLAVVWIGYDLLFH